ncbi:hypothetical protein ACFVTC_42035 [Streptomyces sp. NPDC057950]|uniref:hypothetical protein n=1 Tax=Streptomyces sp. NPDC057950 TaxID=3346288 RepID=UPI0036E7A025
MSKKKHHAAVRAAGAGIVVEKAQRAAVPVEIARRRLRVGSGVLGGAVGGAIVIPALLERFGVMHSGAWVPAMFAGLALAMGFPLLYMTSHSVRHGPGWQLLTARTVTGSRTVDLSKLTQIRRVRVPSKTGWLDEFWIKDCRGVVLLVDKEALMGPMGQAVVHSSGISGSLGTVKISRHAAVGLGLNEPSTVQQAARAWADFLLGILIPGAVAVLGILASWLTRSA